MTSVYTEHFRTAAYHACRAVEALEDNRDGDDDVLQARHKHLFDLLATLTLAKAINGIQILQVKAEGAIASYFSGDKARALEVVRDILGHHLIKPHADLSL